MAEQVRKTTVWEARVVRRPPEREGVMVMAVTTTQTIRLVSDERPSAEDVLALFGPGAELLGRVRELYAAFVVG